MKLENIKEYGLLLVALMAAMMLSIVPVSTSVMRWQPPWVLLVLVFWLSVSPNSLGFGVLWCIGLVQDLLLATPLGLHAFLFILVGFLLIKMISQLPQYPLWQQLATIAGIVLLQALVQWLVLLVLGQSVNFGYLLLPVLTSCLVWPVMFRLMYGVWRRRLMVY